MLGKGEKQPFTHTCKNIVFAFFSETCEYQPQKVGHIQIIF